MRNIIITFVAIFLLASCQSKSDTAAVVDSCLPTDVQSSIRQGFQLTCIQDHQQRLPLRLFSATDSGLIGSLVQGDEVEASINVFLLTDGHRYYLVDAGLGADKGGQMLKQLSKMVDPSKVDGVILTHLHPDHIGGMVNDQSATFPNAQIYIATAEFDAWTNGAMSKDNAQVMEMLSYYSQNLNLFNDGDTIVDTFVDAVTGERFPIVAHVLKGHTPGHTLLTVGDVMIAADLLHARDLQLEHPEICCQFDHNKKLAQEERTYWLGYAKEHKMTLAGSHLPAPHYVDFGAEGSSL